MTRAVVALIGAFVLLAATAGRADDSGSPHHMTKADGALDTDKCPLCHNEDFSLQRSKLETCTLCHAQTAHAGSDEHVRANPDAVKHALEGQQQATPALPLADDGHIYCGTCHLFHDPQVASEDWLATGWVPPAAGVSGAVRQTVIDRWAAVASQSGNKEAIGHLATDGTRQLRLPVAEGQLCLRCHGANR